MLFEMLDILFILIDFLYKKADFILTKYGLIISEDLKPVTFQNGECVFFFLLQCAKISYYFFSLKIYFYIIIFSSKVIKDKRSK